MSDTDLLLIAAVWVLSAFLAATIARRRGFTNASVWAFIGLVLGPLGVLWSAVARPRSG